MVNIQTITTTVRNQQQAASVDAVTLTGLVHLEAAPLPDDMAPSPLFLVAVLDQSSSMSGQKITMLKDTMKRLIAKLRPIDTLAIVTYHTDVSVILHPTLMTKENASHAKDLVQGIGCLNSTNLCGGLMEGIQLVPSTLPSDTVVSTLLLTDGQANVGPEKSEEIIALMNHYWDKEDAPRKSAVYTFGYGSDHNSELLRAVAKAGNGLYYYIENEDRIADCFADVLGGLLSVVAQNVIVTVEACEAIDILELYTGEYSKTKVSPAKFRILLSDLQSEEFRDIPVVLSVPASGIECTTSLLKIGVEYFDSLSKCVGCHEASLSIDRVTELSEEQMKLDVEIDGHINRVETCGVLKAAKKLAKENSIKLAKELIDKQIAKIRESVSGELPLCGRLIQDLELSKEAMSSYSRYEREGGYRMTNCISIHSRQRAAPQNYSREMQYSYCNASRYRMQSEF